MDDVCEACGRPFEIKGRPEELIELRQRDALLYAEKLIRSSVASERMIGADLKQILEA